MRAFANLCALARAASLAGLLGLPGLATALAPPDAADPWQRVPFDAPLVPEASGLAASTRAPGTFWVNNDSFNPAELYRLDPASGRVVQTLRVSAPEVWDWEDLDGFTLDGRPWLLVADTGTNVFARNVVVLNVLPEPPPGPAAVTLVPAWRRLVRFPGPAGAGAPDIEAVAVDSTARTVYLVSKRAQPPHLWRVPLGGPPLAARLSPGRGRKPPRPPAEPTLTATDLGPLRLPRTGPAGSPQDWPTALAFAPDGRQAALLTARAAYVWTRPAGAGWATVLRQPPGTSLALPRVAGFEALAFDAAQHLWIAAEGQPLQVFRAALPDPVPAR